MIKLIAAALTAALLAGCGAMGSAYDRAGASSTGFAATDYPRGSTF